MSNCQCFHFSSVIDFVILKHSAPLSVSFDIKYFLLRIIMGVEHNCKTSNCAWHIVKTSYVLNVKIIFVILFHLFSEKANKYYSSNCFVEIHCLELHNFCGLLKKENSCNKLLIVSPKLIIWVNHLRIMFL